MYATALTPIRIPPRERGHEASNVLVGARGVAMDRLSPSPALHAEPQATRTEQETEMHRDTNGTDVDQENDSAPAAGTTTDDAPRTARFFSAEKVAEMLGIHHADVIALVRSGDLAAKRVGPTVFITADQLGRFMARHDHRASFPRYSRGDVVLFLDKDGTVGRGRFIGETAGGRVALLRAGFWGDYQDAFPPEQVQPFTCRFPRTALN
jgi:hypothetical protein